MLIDTHFHLDLMENMQTLIQELAASKDIGIFAVGTTPMAYKREKAFCKGSRNICVGLGLHPQLISERANEIRLFINHIVESNVIGEIGLDFSPAYKSSCEQQLVCFREICKVCAHEGRKCLSIHSVKSAGIAISILEDSCTFKTCRCILHWFTGSKSELRKAVENGAYFSINPRMINTKGGQEIIKSVPLDRLLLETDAPFACRVLNVEQLKKELTGLLHSISTIRGFDIGDQLEENSISILTMCQNV